MRGVPQLRAAIDAFRRDEAVERVARWRGSEGALSASAVASRHASLASPEVAEVLADAASSVEPSSHAALSAHVARLAMELELGPSRDALRASIGAQLDVGSSTHSLRDLALAITRERSASRRAGIAASFDRMLEPLSRALLDARVRADEAAYRYMPQASQHPDIEPDPKVTLALAERVIAGTEDLVAELSIARDVPGDPSMIDRAYVLAASELAGVFRGERFRRVAGSLSGLELDTAIRNRLRAEGSHGGLSPRVRIAAVAVPNDVRIAPGGIELGLASELAAFEGFGRGVALVLVTPALPVELARPVAGTVSRAIGTLFATRLADRRFVQKTYSLTTSEAARVARASLAQIVVELRLLAASLIVRRTAAGSEREQIEHAAQLLSRAAHAQVDGKLATLLALTPSAIAARFRGRVHGLALAVAMRERYDEEWHRRRVASELLRVGAERGGAISVEGLAAEQGISTDAVVPHLHELFG